MEQPEHLRPTDGAPSEPRPQRWNSPVELWVSEDPWDRDVADNIDELAWRLSELREMGDEGKLRGWARLR